MSADFRVDPLRHTYEQLTAIEMAANSAEYHAELAAVDAARLLDLVHDLRASIEPTLDIAGGGND